MILRIIRQPLVSAILPFLFLSLLHHAAGNDGEDVPCKKQTGTWIIGDRSLQNNQAICSPDGSSKIFFLSDGCKLGMSVCVGSSCETEYLKNPNISGGICSDAVLSKKDGDIKVIKDSNEWLLLSKKTGGFGSSLKPAVSAWIDSGGYNNKSTMTISNEGVFTIEVENEAGTVTEVWRKGRSKTLGFTCIGNNLVADGQLTKFGDKTDANSEGYCSHNQERGIYFNKITCQLILCTTSTYDNSDGVPCNRDYNFTPPFINAFDGCYAGLDVKGSLNVYNKWGTQIYALSSNGSFGDRYTPPDDLENSVYAKMAVNTDSIIIDAGRDPLTAEHVWCSGGTCTDDRERIDITCDDDDEALKVATRYIYSSCLNYLEALYDNDFYEYPCRNSLGGKLVATICPYSCYTYPCNHKTQSNGVLKSCYDAPEINCVRKARKGRCFEPLGNKFVRDYCYFSCKVDETCQYEILMGSALRGNVQ